MCLSLKYNDTMWDNVGFLANNAGVWLEGGGGMLRLGAGVIMLCV